MIALNKTRISEVKCVKINYLSRKLHKAAIGLKNFI